MASGAVSVRSDFDVIRMLSRNRTTCRPSNHMHASAMHTLSEVQLLLPLAWRSLLMYALQMGG